MEASTKVKTGHGKPNLGQIPQTKQHILFMRPIQAHGLGRARRVIVERGEFGFELEFLLAIT